jgi:membrane-associated phospholipid phosphatase
MATTSASPNRLDSPRRVGGQWEALLEILLGCALLGAATLAGLVFVRRPWPNRVDAIGLSFLRANNSSGWARDVAHLGSSSALIAGVAVLCVVAALSRNWMRALASLIAPIVAVLIVQTVAKPLVGRQLEGTLSYPSGTVTAVAALAAAAFLLLPRFAKPIGAVAAGVIVAAACAAVVVLRWHYPTDAFGGVCVGAGAVFALDGILTLGYNRRSAGLRS